MFLLKALAVLYIGLCFVVTLYSANKIADKNKVTRGDIIVYTIFILGFILGAFLSLFIIFLDIIENNEESTKNWWNTPIKK